MFGSKNPNWETPKWLILLCTEIFHLEIDAASSDRNAKFGKCLTEKDDSLEDISWSTKIAKKYNCANIKRRFWLNPPYGRQIPKWVKKVCKEVEELEEVLVLLPARTDTKWFKKIQTVARVTYFLEGRLTFLDNDYCSLFGLEDIKGEPAPFPSVLIYCSRFDANVNDEKLRRLCTLVHP